MQKADRVDKLKVGNLILEPKAENKIEEINPKKIKKIVSSKVVPFSKSGAYIPISQDYKHHKVYVIVMDEKAENSVAVKKNKGGKRK